MSLRFRADFLDPQVDLHELLDLQLERWGSSDGDHAGVALLQLDADPGHQAVGGGGAEMTLGGGGAETTLAGYGSSEL